MNKRFKIVAMAIVNTNSLKRFEDSLETVANAIDNRFTEAESMLTTLEDAVVKVFDDETAHVI